MTAVLARPPAAPRPQATSTRRPPLRVVGRTRHARRYIALMILVIVLAVFGGVSLNALAAEQSFAHRALVTEVDTLHLRLDELTVGVARLEAPDRIRRVAETRLGMVEAQQPAFLALEPARANSRVASRDPNAGG
ncbi:MAG: hypothetical protein M3493_09030 [Actinomycetota bacterium]|nr:hypothetical protein [Euzebyaceae bacterium]MBA3621666.1 hypothetical protein [Euzebyales bacterium]MDQ3452819.1 hypothetical protein [Actinomycetota bacterium]